MRRKTGIVMMFAVSLIFLAAVPRFMNFQGKITSPGGIGITDTLPVTFRIFLTETGGEPIWSETDTVFIERGLFNVRLGLVNPLNIPFDQLYWIEMIVGSDTLRPREPLLSAPYAFRSAIADSAVNAGGTGANLDSIYVNEGQANSITSAMIVNGTIQPEDIGFRLLSSLNGITSYYRNIDIVGDSGVIVTPNDLTKQIIIGVDTTKISPKVHNHWGQTWRGNSVGLGLRANDNGPALVATTDSLPLSLYSIFGGAGIYGIARGDSAAGLAGFADSVPGVSYTSFGVLGRTYESSGRGVQGENAIYNTYGYLGGPSYAVYGRYNSNNYGYIGASGYGVWGRGSNYGVYGTGQYGAYGTSTTFSGAGLYGTGNDSTYGVRGVTSAKSRGIGTTPTVCGVLGETNGQADPAQPYNNNIAGVRGTVNFGAGVGVMGVNGAGTLIPAIGTSTFDAKRETVTVCGVLGLGGTFPGVYGYSTTSAGVWGHTFAASGTAAGVRGDFTGTSTGLLAGKGVYGFAKNGYGVYGETQDSNYVGVYYSGVRYGLAGTGTKSCVEKTSRGPVLMFSQESPEVWFEDFGYGKLTDGKAEIKLDERFLEIIYIDEENPLLVFLQPMGECNGLYAIPHKDGFSVRENGGGKSNIGFAYRVVAHRKGYEKLRMPLYPPAYSDRNLYPELHQKSPEQPEQK